MDSIIRMKRLMGFIRSGCILVLMGALLMAAERAHAVSWRSDLKAALADAKETQKPVMADFYTTWCGWCTRLDTDTYSAGDVDGLSREFICVKVDADKDTAAASRYGVQGYPTIIFFNYEGAVDERIGGYRGPKDFAAMMRTVLKKTRRPRAQRADHRPQTIDQRQKDAQGKEAGGKRLELNGIAYHPRSPYAFINNTRVKAGDTIEGAQVIKITGQAVELLCEGQRVTLEMDNR